MAALFKPVLGLHEYELPLTLAVPIVVLVVVQSKYLVAPASATGFAALT